MFDRRQRLANTNAALGAAAYLTGSGTKSVYNRLTGATLGVSAKSVENRLMSRVVRATHEPKNIDLAASTFALSITTTPNIILLNPIVQGTTGNNRTGREVVLDSLRLSLIFDQNTTALSDDLIRVMLVVDRECRSASMGSADLISSNSSSALQVNSSVDFDNFPRRFRLLHDKVYLLPVRGENANTSNTLSRILVPLQIKLNQKVHYYNASNAGTIGDIDSGALTLIVWSYNATSGTVSSMSYDSRVVFRDL
jgi:hypothetical protein